LFREELRLLQLNPASPSSPAREASCRRARWILAVLLLSVPLTVFLVTEAIRSNVNDVRDWLPAHYPETAQYQWFRERFGSEDFVVASWPGCTLDSSHLSWFADNLRERSNKSIEQGELGLFSRVLTGSELVDELSSDRIGLTREQAIARLKGTLIGPDGKQTCAVLTINDAARPHLAAVLREVSGAASDIGLSHADLHLGGPPIVNDAIDRASTESLVSLAGMAGVVGVIIAWLCFRDLRMTALVFIVAGYSAAVSLAMVALCGVPLNAIMITMVPLVYVAAMSGAIHLSNYYLESLARLGSEWAVSDAVRHAILPLTLATVTTAVGLLSLWYSDLEPIRLFGLFSAVGVMVGLAMQLVILPAFLTLWPASRGAGTLPARTKDEVELAVEPLPPRWRRLTQEVIEQHRLVSGLLMLCIAVGIAGLARVETSIQIMRLFAPSTPIIASYEWLESKLGAMVPMEVVIHFDERNRQSTLERLRLIRELHASITQHPKVSGCLSAATFMPELRDYGRSIGGVVARTRLKQALPRLSEAGYVYSGSADEGWRISVRVNAGDDLDYGVFQEQLRNRVEPILQREQGRGNEGLAAVYTGAVPIIYKARRSLLDGLIMGFGTDVLLVVVSIVALIRNWSSGILLFVTSVFPLTIVFGLMGWCGVVVDIGSVMAPCVALGVTIDDAIHFLLWFRKGIERGLSEAGAVALAYAGCGRAMIQSWGVIGIGLSVFALSSFVPTFRFGTLTIALLTAALICNLVLLPALLAGPLGRVLAAGVRRRAKDTGQAKVGSPTMT
jgi:predicted RND superfamily exporter protein